MSNMKIKHYVITRFLSSLTLGLGERVFDEDIIQDGLGYARSYFIPSMNNQTVKDFTVIFMINQRHDTENSRIKELYDMKLDMPFKVLKDIEWFDYVLEDSKDADWVILTRMDYDDLVNRKAAEEVQDLVRENEASDIFSYGYNTGMILYEKQLYSFIKPSYWKQGYFSVFESICVKRSVLNPDINIYNFNHTQLKSEVNNYAKEHGLKAVDTSDKDTFNNFVWVRHKNTGTELNTGVIAAKSRFRNKLQMSSDTFKGLFGREL